MLQHGDRAEVERVARRPLEGLDPALAEDDPLVPLLATYSAAISSSSTDADGPRFSSTGLSARPTSASSMKFCMLRAPIWITSAASSTSSTWRGSISSVTIGSPVSSRASRRIVERVLAEPLEGVRRRARLEGAAAQPRRAGRRRPRARSRASARGLDRARPGDQAEELVADRRPLDVDHGRVGRDLARDELVRLQDRQHLLDARVALERQRREQLALADRADHGRLAPAHARVHRPPQRSTTCRLSAVACAPMTIRARETGCHPGSGTGVADSAPASPIVAQRVRGGSRFASAQRSQRSNQVSLR